MIDVNILTYIPITEYDSYEGYLCEGKYVINYISPKRGWRSEA